MNRFQFIALFLVVILVFLTSCSARNDVEASSEIESSVVEFSLSSTSEPESEPKQQENESSTESRSTERDDNVVSSVPAPPSSAQSVPAEAAAPERAVVITVEEQTVQGESTSSITDSTQQEKILAFVDSLVESDLQTPPATGGKIYNVNITRAGSQTVEQYTFTGQKTEDGYIMAKNSQNPRVWLLADETSYDYLQGIFE